MKKQMKKQKMKLLLISLFLIGTVSSCENVVNNNTEKDPQNELLSIESDTISDTKSDTISDTISNAQEHCDFEDFIKEEIGYLNGGFNSKGRLDLGNINISSMLSKPSFATNTYIEDIPYIGFIDIKIKRRLEINFLKIEKSTTNDSLYIAKGKTKVGKNVRLFEGDIKIKHVYFFAEHSKGLEDDMVGKIKSQGIIIADGLS